MVSVHTVYAQARKLMSYELKYQTRCLICKKRLFNYNDLKGKRVGYKQVKVVDHITPLCYGGSNNKENLQVICTSCNVKKRKLDTMNKASGESYLINKLKER